MRHDPSVFEMKTFRISNVSLLSGEQIGSHSQPTWELSLVIDGHGKRIIGSSEEPFYEGDLVLVPPMVEHCWQFDTDGMVRNITVEMEPQWLASIPNVMPDMEQAVTTLLTMKPAAMTFEPHAHDEIARLLKRMPKKDRIDQFASLLRVIRLMAQQGHAESIDGAERRADMDERRKERIRIYIECNHNRRISLDDAARQVDMSRTSFCRWFRQNYHTTFITHVKLFRLERMATLLSDQSLTINEVCYKSGFGDTAYATRLFHAHFGLTPTAYRAAKRPKAELEKA